MGCDEEEKEAFRADLEEVEVVGKIPRDERLVIGADLKCSCGGRKHQR